MSKTEFSQEPQHIKNELFQDIIDLLLYNPKASKELLKVVGKYEKPYTMQEMKSKDGEALGKLVRTIKLD